MAFAIPTFPLLANIWPLTAQVPPTGTELTSVPCSIGPVPYILIASGASVLFGEPQNIIRLPSKADVRDNLLPNQFTAFPTSVLEVPAGSGNYYVSLYSRVVGKGFPNEHRRVIAQLYVANWTGPAPP